VASTALGPEAVTVLAMVAALVFALRREMTAAFLVVASPLGASMIENVLKTLVGRHRPHLWPGAQVLHSYSFPSGHATDAAALFAALCFLAWSRWDARRSIAATAVSCLLVLAVGVSRVYLGVHWPTDVIGGFSLALCWVSLLVVLLSVRSARWTPR
jgi:undecaprenyl-diphosphatase